MARPAAWANGEFSAIVDSLCPSLDSLVRSAVHPCGIKVVVEPGTLDVIVIYLFEEQAPISLRLTQRDVWNLRSQQYEQLAVLAN